MRQEIMMNIMIYLDFSKISNKVRHQKKSKITSTLGDGEDMEVDQDVAKLNEVKVF